MISGASPRAPSPIGNLRRFSSDSDFSGVGSLGAGRRRQAFEALQSQMERSRSPALDKPPLSPRVGPTSRSFRPRRSSSADSNGILLPVSPLPLNSNMKGTEVTFERSARAHGERQPVIRADDAGGQDNLSASKQRLHLPGGEGSPNASPQRQSLGRMSSPAELGSGMTSNGAVVHREEGTSADAPRVPAPVLASGVAYRMSPSGEMEVLLVSARHSDHWIIPKGHVETGEDFLQASMRETLEEGGVETKPVRYLGMYRQLSSKRNKTSIIHSYLLEVTKILDDREWPEANERRRDWVPVRAAIRLVSRPEMQAMLCFAMFPRTHPRLSSPRSDRGADDDSAVPSSPPHEGGKKRSPLRPGRPMPEGTD